MVKRKIFLSQASISSLIICAQVMNFGFYLFIGSIVMLAGTSWAQGNLPKLKNALVRVRVLDESGQLVEMGSGAIIQIKENRVLVLTARHVVLVADKPEASDIEIVTENGDKMKAKIFKQAGDPKMDFAVLESLPDQNIPRELCYLKIKKKSRYQLTEKIVVVGFPNDRGNLSFYRGNLESTEGTLVYFRLDGDHLLPKGISGSPLLDKNLHLIGLIPGHDDKINHAIRGDKIGQILEDWGIQYTLPPNPWFVRGSLATTALAGFLSYKFHAKAENELEQYNAAITVKELQKHWDGAAANRQRGNIAAGLAYAAAAFTGYQLWRQRYLPIGRDATCRLEFYPTVRTEDYAWQEPASYGIGLRLSF